MKVLVTGAASRLGLHLAHAWARHAQFELRLTDFMARPDGLASHLNWVQADLRDPEAIPDLVRDVDHVLHLESLFLPVQEGMDPAAALFRGTCGLYNLAGEAQRQGARRFVLASSLALYDRLPAHWQVTEAWRPRPTPALADLSPWLAELSLREIIRKGAMTAVCLRLGRLVGDEASDMDHDPRWVHLDDAVQGIERALVFDAGQMRNATHPDWFVFHITAPGPKAKIRLKYETGVEERSISSVPPFSYRPTRDFQAQWPAHNQADPERAMPWREAIQEGASVPSRAIRNVVIFGACGPMGSVTASEMASAYRLRMADLRSREEVLAMATEERQQRPLPPPLTEPHEYIQVDMRDTRQVVDACRGMDAIVNCSVLRPHLHQAFGVNTVGAFNVALGAIQHGIRRVVQTGPFQQMDPGYGSYIWDYDITVDAPARPLDYLYHHTKYLGQEILRVFGEYHDLEVAVLLFWRLVADGETHQIPPFAVSWADSGRALRRAVEIPELPSPYEEFNVSAELPHRKHSFRKTREVLGFVARDDIAAYWQEPPDAA